MRPTRLGWSAIGLCGLTLFAASSTGNNLLYLIFAATAAAAALSIAAAKASVSGVIVRLEPPDQAFRGSPAWGSVEASNGGKWAARLLRVVGPDGAAELGDLEPGETRRADLRLVLPHRGLNLVDGVVLETAYPFGLFVLRRALPAVSALALPQASPFAIQAEIEVDPRAAGAAFAGGKKGRGGTEFWGPRPYGPDDDSRLIHWKLTAKSGKPVVAEHAASPDGKVVVRLEGDDEASVERAAAACRWHIDAGAEVGLSGPGADVPPARGLHQLDKMLKALALVGAGAKPRPVEPAPPPADDGPADSKGLRRLTLFGAALVYLAMFLIDETDARGLLALGPVVPLGIWLHERGGPFPPARLWTVLSVAMLGFLVLVDWKWSGVALANAHLLAYLLINRLLNPWSRSELRQVFLIIYLAFVLVSGLTIDLWYFPLFLAWLVFASSWLMIQAGEPSGEARRWGPSLAGLLGAGAVVGITVFMTAPRVESLRRFNPFVATGLDKLQTKGQSVMGFTDRVSLGHYGSIRRSSARVMRVKPAGDAPPGAYVRGSALDRFDGRAWSRAPLDFKFKRRGKTLRTERGRAWAAKSARHWTLVDPPDGPDGEWEINLYPMPLTVVFSVGGAWKVEGFDQPVWFDHAGGVSPAAPYANGPRYTVRTLPPGRYPSDAAEGLEVKALAAALEVPQDPGGRIAGLAAKMTEGAADPEAKIAAIGKALADGYAYSTYSDGKRTGLGDFLFDVKRGNCEYFATAGAILLRHAGVPSRLVAGFHTDAFNEYDRAFDVRQSDAHAWVEAYVPGKGWVTFDPTPAQSGFGASADAVLERLSRWADAAQGAWYRRVVGYDQYTQRDAFIRLGFGRGLDRLRSVLSKILRAGLVIGLLLALAGALARALSAWRRGADEYERAEAALARAGLKRAGWQTPREFAREVAAARPELADVAELAEEHYNRRWGGRTPDAAAKARSARLLSNIKEKL